MRGTTVFLKKTQKSLKFWYSCVANMSLRRNKRNNILKYLHNCVVWNDIFADVIPADSDAIPANPDVFRGDPDIENM